MYTYCCSMVLRDILTPSYHSPTDSARCKNCIASYVPTFGYAISWDVFNFRVMISLCLII